MQKRALAVAVVVLAALAFQVARLDPPADPADEASPARAPLLPGLALEDVVGLDIGPEGKGVRLRKVGARWVVDPGSHPAEEAVAQLAARAVSRTDSLRKLDGAAPSEDYGLGAGATEVVVTAADGTQRRLELGDAVAVGEGRYVAVDDAVHVADATALSVLERDPLDYRDRRVLPLDRSAVDRLRLIAPGADPLGLERADGVWRLAGEPGWRADAETVDGLLRSLSSLSATAWPGGAPPEADWAIEAAAGDRSASLVLGPPDEAGLRLAWAAGDLLPAGVGDEAARVGAAFLDGLPTAGGWRSRALLPVDAADVASFTWSAAGEAWTLRRGPDGWARSDGELVDDGAVTDFVRAALALRADGFREEEAADGSVEVARLAIETGDGSRLQLDLLRGPHDDLVRVSGEPGLFEVPGDVNELLGRLRPFDESAPE